MLALPQITRIYIDELSASETASLPIKVLKLVIEPDNTAENFAIDLARQAETEISDTTARKNFINLLEIIIVYKLPQKTREEVAAMFSLTDLKQTRFYQDVFAEGKAEAEAEAEAKAEAKAEAEAKQRNKVAILRNFSRGLAIEDIATFLDLPVTEVAAIITEAQKEQAEQAEQN